MQNQNQPLLQPPQMQIAVATTGSLEGYNYHDATGKYMFKHKGSFAVVEVLVSHRDLVKSQAGALVSMPNGVDLSPECDGGCSPACNRYLCAGETLFFNFYRPSPTVRAGEAQDVMLAPALPGDLALLHLGPGEDWRVSRGHFLAADEGVELHAECQGASACCCAQQGCCVMHARGSGRMVVSAFGAIVRYDLRPGEVRKCESGSLVAWTGSMPFEIAWSSKSVISSLFAGAGDVLICQFTGPGTVFVHTRSLPNFAAALAPYIK